MAQEIHTKGLGLRSFLSTLERLHGKSAVAATLERVPEDLHRAIAYGTIVASGWYPVAWHKALHAAAQEATGLGSELARKIGQDGTRADFRGVYKFVAALLSPEMLLRQSARVFGTYYDGGTLEVVESSKGFARGICRDCHGFDRNLWQNVLGGIDSALEAAGAKDVSVVIDRGGRDGDSTMEMTARWR